jgi:hypothetical protein
MGKKESQADLQTGRKVYNPQASASFEHALTFSEKVLDLPSHTKVVHSMDVQNPVKTGIRIARLMGIANTYGKPGVIRKHFWKFKSTPHKLRNPICYSASRASP